jgi:hypothetical protein
VFNRSNYQFKLHLYSLYHVIISRIHFTISRVEQFLWGGGGWWFPKWPLPLRFFKTRTPVYISCVPHFCYMYFPPPSYVKIVCSLPVTDFRDLRSSHLHIDLPSLLFSFEYMNIVTWWLEAGIVEWIDAVTARQQHGKHISTAMDNVATI